jgi:hypothetical protein
LGLRSGDPQCATRAKIISQPAKDSLAVQREVRNLRQHVYVELTVSALRDAVKQQMDSTPRIIKNITSWGDGLSKRYPTTPYPLPWPSTGNQQATA